MKEPEETKNPAADAHSLAGMKVISLGELLDKEFPKRKHLILPWLRQGESAMVYAAPGVGKSLFALDLALTVAGGGRFLNEWEGPGEGEAWKVLYVDGEMPLDDIQARAAMIQRGKALTQPGTFDTEKSRKNLRFMARSHQEIDAPFTDLADEGRNDTLLHAIIEDGCNLVILDNLSTLAELDDENAANAFNKPVIFLQKLKSANVACLLVHHTNKQGDAYRGSSKIATTFETLMMLSAVENDKEKEQEDDAATENQQEAQNTFRIEWHKCRGKRDTRINRGVIATMTTAPDEGGNDVSVWTCKMRVSGPVYEMLAVLKAGNCASQSELAKVLGVTRGRITQLKKKAMEMSLVTQAEFDACFKQARQRGKKEETEGGSEEF